MKHTMLSVDGSQMAKHFARSNSLPVLSGWGKWSGKEKEEGSGRKVLLL